MPRSSASLELPKLTAHRSSTHLQRTNPLDLRKQSEWSGLRTQSVQHVESGACVFVEQFVILKEEIVPGISSWSVSGLQVVLP